MRQPDFLVGKPRRPGQLSDLSWYGPQGHPVDWGSRESSLTCLLAAAPRTDLLGPVHHHVMILFHASADACEFRIPQAVRSFSWWQFVNTAAESPDDVYPELDGPAPRADGIVPMQGRSLVCFVARDEH